MKGCTLDKLHEHVQTAMGWTNSHLHHFRVGAASRLKIERVITMMP